MSKSGQKENIEFEIAFYNGLIAKNPNFVEALVALAELYTVSGMIDHGLTIDERLAQLKPDDPVILYNLACSYSLTNQIDKAYRSMKKAIHCGYADFRHLDRDRDLDNLRQDRRFQKFISKFRPEKPAAKRAVRETDPA